MGASHELSKSALDGNGINMSVPETASDEPDFYNWAGGGQNG